MRPISKILLSMAVVVLLFLFLLRAFGLMRLFSIPTAAMTPTRAWQHFMMEGLSFLVRKPHRGDVIAFRRTGSKCFLQALSISSVWSGNRVKLCGSRMASFTSAISGCR